MNVGGPALICINTRTADPVGQRAIPRIAPHDPKAVVTLEHRIVGAVGNGECPHQLRPKRSVNRASASRLTLPCRVFANRARSRIGRLGAATRAVTAWKPTLCITTLSSWFFSRTSAVLPTRTRIKEAGDFLIEGPVAIGGAVGKLAGHLDRFEVDLHALGAHAYRSAAEARSDRGRWKRAVRFGDLGTRVCMRHRAARRLRTESFGARRWRGSACATDGDGR